MMSQRRFAVFFTVRPGVTVGSQDKRIQKFKDRE
jgi:hypothetical protein